MASPSDTKPDVEAVALLQRGDVERYNAERGAHPTWSQLGNADLRERNLQRVDFHGVDLRGANLTGADLTRANLDGAQLDGVALKGATLREAVLSHTVLAAPRLEKVDFRGAKVWRAKWPQAQFLACDLRDAVFTESDFDRLVAEKSQLDQLDVSKSTLAGARIVDCRMTAAGALGATLDGAHIDARAPYTMNLSRASAKGAVFGKTSWASPLFIESQLDGATWVEAEMTDADFDGARLENANFRGAVFRESSFRQVRAAGADFTGATFEHCVFKGADLRRARFDGAHFLKRILFEGAQLDGATFTGSDTSQATTDRPDGKFPR